MKSSKRQAKQPPHLRIKVIGCGAVARWIIRPLIAHLQSHVRATFEITLIDGKGNDAQRLASDASNEFPSSKIATSPDYIVADNIDNHIDDGDYLFVCVNNTATIKLISDYAMQLPNLTALNGCSGWNDGMVQIHVRRLGVNLTPQFANKAHPGYATPMFPNPGDYPSAAQIDDTSNSKSVVAANMVASLMIALFQRVQCGEFGKQMPETAEVYIDASIGKVVGRIRTV